MLGLFHLFTLQVSLVITGQMKWVSVCKSEVPLFMLQGLLNNKEEPYKPVECQWLCLECNIIDSISWGWQYLE